MKQLNLGNIKVPVTAATKSFAVLAKRGAGKTYTSAVIAEEMSKANIPFVVFDPIDVWWGLRLAADGKGKGLPVVVFGLEHADIQIDRDMGAKIAREIVKHNISAVISTFGMPKVAQRHLIAEFSEELIKINNTPRHVFIEEAHEFVPQRVQAGMGKCFSAVEALVVMGRNRGIGVTLINQRAATLNKDVLTQVDTLLAFRNVAPQDRKALKEWVEAHSAEEDFDAFFKSLPSLPTGEGWIWSPEFMGVFEKIKIRKRETFHPDREKLGINFKIPTISQSDIAGFIELFHKKPEKGQPISSIKFAGKSVSHETKVPVITQATLEKAINLEKTRAINEIKLYQKRILEWEKYADDLLWALERAVKVAQQFKRPGEIKTEKVNLADIKVRASDLVNLKDKPMTLKEAKPGVSYEVFAARKMDNAILEGIGELKIQGGALRMLKVLVSRHPIKLTRSQLGTFSKMKPTGGSFNTYISTLKTAGLIRFEDGLFSATENGLDYIGDAPNPPQTTEEVIAMWKENLTGGARRMFDILVDQHFHDDGNGMDKETLGEMAGVVHTGGSFGTYMSILRSNGLIETKEGRIHLSSSLFV